MTDEERAILRFEETHPRGDRAKEGAIREAFGLSPARYFQLLNRLVVRGDVAEEFAMLAHRVQRRSAAAVRARAERRFESSAPRLPHGEPGA